MGFLGLAGVFNQGGMLSQKTLWIVHWIAVPAGWMTEALLIAKIFALQNSCPSAEAAIELESWRTQRQGGDVAAGAWHMGRHGDDCWEHRHNLQMFHFE